MMKHSKPKSLNQNERSAKGEEIKLERSRGDFISAFLLLASQTPPAAFISSGYADDIKAP